MSDIFDLADNLLDTISSIVDAKSDACDPLAAHSRSFHTVPEINSIDIVEDCMVSLLHEDEMTNEQNNENQSDEVIVGEDMTYDPHTERSTELSNWRLTKDEAEGRQEENFIFQAAKGRIGRDRERKKGNTPNKKAIGTMVASSKEKTQAEKVRDAENEATACFISFRSDVRSFYGRRKGQENKHRHASSAQFFADLLTERYSGRLEQLPQNIVKVSKVQTLISGFIRRCRVVGAGKGHSSVDISTDTSSLDKLCTKILGISKTSDEVQEQAPGQVPKILCKFKYWTCKVCDKNDLPFENFKCSCCGRPKTHRPLSIEKDSLPMRDPVAEEEAFLNKGHFVDSAEEGESTMEKIIDARVRRQHLYRKFDYDIGQRTQLKRDVKEVISSIQQMVGSSI